MEAVADALYDLPKHFPMAFDAVHFLLCVQSERADMGENGYKSITRKNPLVLYRYFAAKHALE